MVSKISFKVMEKAALYVQEHVSSVVRDLDLPPFAPSKPTKENGGRVRPWGNTPKIPKFENATLTPALWYIGVGGMVNDSKGK
jgi:hypothetical protein